MEIVGSSPVGYINFYHNVTTITLNMVNISLCANIDYLSLAFELIKKKTKTLSFRRV